MLTRAGLFALALTFGCAPAATSEHGGAPPEVPLLGEAKADTGFYSNGATELDGQYRGTVRASYEASDADIEALVRQQIKYAKTLLHAVGLHPNMIVNNVELGERSDGDGAVDIAYTATGETLVVAEGLRAANLQQATDFIGRTFRTQVPAQPQELLTRIGQACAAEDPDSLLSDATYFAYWSPTKAGCAEAAPQTTLEYEVLSAPERRATYPEIDRLAEDGTINALVMYGYDTDATDNDDWGWRDYRAFVAAIEQAGFRAVGNVDGDIGRSYERSRNGITTVVDLLSPAETGSSFEAQAARIRTHEIVIYFGHAKAGTRRGLEATETWGEGYQILGLFACFGYDYYAKQALEAKAALTPDDPHALIDVVAGTEYGLWGDLYSPILLLNLADAAERYQTGGDLTPYSWSAILDLLNARSTVQSDGRRQIVGAGGVATNRFTPPASIE